MNVSEIMYLFFCIIILIFAHRNSIESTYYIQLTIHLVSLIFIYIVYVKQKDNKNRNINQETELFSSIKQCRPELKSCLKNVCQYNNTKESCDEYNRCSWNEENTVCETKRNLCEDLSIKNECNQNNECNWNTESNKCLWNKTNNISTRLHSKCDDVPKYNETCDVEEYGLNKSRCFKAVGIPAKLDNLSNICKKHECESKLGYKVNSNLKCVKFYEPYQTDSNKLCKKTMKTNTTHQHDNSTFTNTILQNTIKSELYIKRNDNSSRFIIKVFILLIIILANIAAYKLLIINNKSQITKK
jgi:hypothetical protein